MLLKRKKSHTDSSSRPTFATTTIAVESPGKAGIKEDAFRDGRVQNDTGRDFAGRQLRQQSGGHPVHRPALADPSPVLVSDESTTGQPRVMEC